MGLIYEPRGRAREYAALACNIYKGCGHGCTYCFAPGATHKTKEEFGQPKPRSATFLEDLAVEAYKRDNAGKHGNVLLCFTCDPYQEIDSKLKLTRQAIEILHMNSHKVTILTKGGTKALRDLDLFGPGDAFATTLTFRDDARTKEWEPKAAPYADRVQAIREFSKAGVFTWVSLEPVIDPLSAFHIASEIYPIVGAFKVGTLNHHPLAKTIDWQNFAYDFTVALEVLGFKRQLNPDLLSKGQYYIKADLARWLE